MAIAMAWVVSHSLFQHSQTGYEFIVKKMSMSEEKVNAISHQSAQHCEYNLNVVYRSKIQNPQTKLHALHLVPATLMFSIMYRTWSSLISPFS